MSEVVKVKINSTNPDVIGSWTKESVEEDMEEIGLEIESPSDWLDYLFDHVFDFEVPCDRVLETARMSSVKSISFYVGNDLVKIEKTFA